MIAFLFPGQGSQHAGMLRAAELLPGGAQTIEEAENVFGAVLRAADDADALTSTLAAQRALFVCGVASARALVAARIAPDAVAGHSVGAFAAAVTAGALTFADAARLVDVRARAMADAFPSGYGMGAVAGLDERDVAALAEAVVRDGGRVYAANVNARDQIAVSGADADVDAVLAAARARGVRSARRLDVHVPSHSPLMDGVARRVADAAAAVTFANPRVPYATNADGRIVRDGGAIRHDLAASLTRAVRWADATRALYESGVRLFLEMLPGTVLADLASFAFPDARAASLETTALPSVVALARA